MFEILTAVIFVVKTGASLISLTEMIPLQFGKISTLIFVTLFPDTET